MAGAVKIVFHYAAFNKFRQQRVIAAELERRGALVAEAAGGSPDYLVSSEITGSRARITVYTATEKAKEEESTNQTLTRALDAGKD